MRYAARLAQGAADIARAQALRGLCFRGPGIIDRDRFDDRDQPTERFVGLRPFRVHGGFRAAPVVFAAGRKRPLYGVRSFFHFGHNVTPSFM